MRETQTTALAQARGLTRCAAQWLDLIDFRAHAAAEPFSPSMSTYHDMLDPAATDAARLAVFVKGVVRRFHAASLISGALVTVSGFSQTGPAGCQLRVLPDQRCGFCARAFA